MTIGPDPITSTDLIDGSLGILALGLCADASDISLTKSPKR